MSHIEEYLKPEIETMLTMFTEGMNQERSSHFLINFYTIRLYFCNRRSRPLLLIRENARGIGFTRWRLPPVKSTLSTRILVHL